MKKVIIVLSCVLSTVLVSAQDESSKHEIGLSFQSLSNFGISYKTGAQSSLWRFNALIVSGQNLESKEDSLDATSKNVGFNVSAGKEFIKGLTEKLEFRYGADVSFGYSHSKNENEDLSIDDRDNYVSNTSYQPGFNFVVGLNYVINEKFVLGAELKPGISYFSGTTCRKYNSDQGEKKNIEEISGIRYGLSSTSALLTLAYRF